METSFAAPALEISPQIMDNPFMSKRDDAPVAAGFPKDEPLADLIARGRSGDAGALESIYHRFRVSFFNLARRYAGDRATAEDLLQDIFIKIFTHLDDVKNSEMFPGWAYRIALNTCFSHLREKKSSAGRTVALNDLEFALPDVSSPGPESDLRKPLEDAIAGLPARLKQVFLLHDVQGFKHEEIAGMLRLSVGTSKSQLFKARLKIRTYLKARRIGPGERS
jgi:RNA polymerase sigma-70 factor (ECF subfamily)